MARLIELLPCPFCTDGKVNLKEKAIDVTYRNQVYKVIQYLYECDKCNESFTTTESDGETLKQIPGFLEEHGTE